MVSKIILWIAIYCIIGIVSCVLASLTFMKYEDKEKLKKENLTANQIYSGIFIVWPIVWILFILGFIKGMRKGYKIYKNKKKFKEKMEEISNKTGNEAKNENGNETEKRNKEIYEHHDINN